MIALCTWVVAAEVSNFLDQPFRQDCLCLTLQRQARLQKGRNALKTSSETPFFAFAGISAQLFSMIGTEKHLETDDSRKRLNRIKCLTP